MHGNNKNATLVFASTVPEFGGKEKHAASADALGSYDRSAYLKRKNSRERWSQSATCPGLKARPFQ
jgi:hypothetical protein